MIKWKEIDVGKKNIVTCSPLTFLFSDRRSFLKFNLFCYIYKFEKITMKGVKRCQKDSPNKILAFPVMVTEFFRQVRQAFVFKGFFVFSLSDFVSVFPFDKNFLHFTGPLLNEGEGKISPNFIRLVEFEEFEFSSVFLSGFLSFTPWKSCRKFQSEEKSKTTENWVCGQSEWEKTLFWNTSNI